MNATYIGMIPAINLGIEDGDQVWVVVELASEGRIKTITLGVVDHPWMIPSVPLGVKDGFIVVI